MVVLHPDSRKLTCMALPFGRFQWTRLPMGTVVLLHCGCLSLYPFIEFSIRNNSSSSDVLNIQASISISPKFESK